MKTAGFYTEFWNEPPAYATGSIREAIAPEHVADGKRIAAYLESGYTLLDVMGAPMDVLGSGTPITGGPSVVTDGEWLWRADLAFYVEKHDVLPPAELVERIRSLDYQMPHVDVETLRAITAEAADQLGWRSA